MAFYVNENGDITLVQGDSGNLVIEGISTDANYVIYFAIQDSKRKPVGSELSVNSNMQDTAVIAITASYTDMLTVEKNKPFETYYYGLKICNSTSGLEDTLVVNDGDIGDLNTITVYPKKVEGLT